MSKRSYTELDVSTKIALIECAESEKLSQRKLAGKFKISKTQVQRILGNKSKILQTVDNFGLLKRKRVASCTKYGELDVLLFKWFTMARSKKLPLSGSLLQEKALKIGEQLNLTDFTASNGWLQSFKERHNLQFISLSGEGASIDANVVEKYRETLHKLTEPYDPKNIFNLDETGLFFRATPSRSLQLKNEKCKGGKMCKERITLALLCNMLGEKENCLIIGKAKKPRAFKNLNVEQTFNVYWRFNKKAWMTSVIFDEWIGKINQKMVKQNRKIVIFLDNAPCHPDKPYSNVKLQFFPPNTTSALQPLDQGIIRSVKMNYRKLLMNRLLTAIDESDGVEQLSKQITVLDACSWVSTAWKNTTPETIANCFRYAGFKEPTVTSDVEIIQEPDQFESGSEFFRFQENLQTSEELSEDWEHQFFATLHDRDSQNEENVESSSSDGDDLSQISPSIITFAKAQACLRDLKDYASEKGLNEMFFHLEKSEETLVEKEVALKTIQAPITAYFTTQPN